MKNTHKFSKYCIILAILLVLIVSGCAATVAAPTIVCGFWAGLWHGIISPITFFISLFNSNVAIYSVVNLGHLYDFGFVLGTGGLASLIKALASLIAALKI